MPMIRRQPLTPDQKELIYDVSENDLPHCHTKTSIDRFHKDWVYCGKDCDKPCNFKEICWVRF